MPSRVRGCWQGCRHLHCQRCSGRLHCPRGAGQVLPRAPQTARRGPSCPPGQAAGGLLAPSTAGVPAGAPPIQQRKIHSICKRFGAFLTPLPLSPPWTCGITCGVGSHVGHRAVVVVTTSTALHHGAAQGGTRIDGDMREAPHMRSAGGDDSVHPLIEWDIGCQEWAQTHRAPHGFPGPGSGRWLHTAPG